MHQWFKRWFPAGLFLGLMAGWLSLPMGRAQVSSTLSKYAKAANFKKPLSYYEGQYQGQARAILMGEEAHFGPDGKTYQLKGMKLEMYHETGERELVVKSPECVYNNDTKVANSPGRLELQTIHEGRYAQGPGENPGLFTEGRGFLWDQLNGRLILSNDVHTVLYRELLKPAASATNAARAPGATNAPLDITSVRADISITNRVAQYYERVKVDDPRTQITSELLTIRGLASSNNQVESVVAEKSVVIINKQDQSRATGEMAVYAATNDVVTLTGDPAIENAQGKMLGDRIVLSREQNLLETHGHVRMTVNGSTNASAPRQPLQLTADEARANLTNRVALYTSNVRAEDPKMQLEAQWLEVHGAEKGGGVERLHARTGVVIVNKDDQSHATGDEAVYEATNNIVTLTGSPRLENAQGNLSADKLVLHRADNELFATENVRTEIHYGAKDAGKKTDATGKSGTNAPPMVVFAEAGRFKFTNKFAYYTGHVRADDTKMLITSEKLTVQGALNTNRLETIVAEESVTMTNRLDRSHATGTKAVYDARTDVVTLTGSPMLQNDQGKLFGETIVLNRAGNTLEASGGIKTEIISVQGLGATNRARTNVTMSATNKVAEPMLVTAQSVKAWLTNRSAIYRDRVQVDSTRMQMNCDELTVLSAPAAPGKTNTVEKIIATGKILIIDKLEGTRITGTKAVYLAATDTVEITGTPTVEREKGNVSIVSEEVIIWDRAHNTLRARGNPGGTLVPAAFKKTTQPKAASAAPGKQN